MEFIDHIVVKNNVVLRVKEGVDTLEAATFAVQFCGQFQTKGFLYIGKTGIPVSPESDPHVLMEYYKAAKGLDQKTDNQKSEKNNH